MSLVSMPHQNAVPGTQHWGPKQALITHAQLLLGVVVCNDRYRIPVLLNCTAWFSSACRVIAVFDLYLVADSVWLHPRCTVLDQLFSTSSTPS